MAGSPEYLALLDEHVETPIPLELTWRDLDLAWDDLTSERPVSIEALDDLAAVSFKLLAQETEEDIDSIINDPERGARALHINKNAGYAGANNPDPWANFRLSSVFGIDPIDGVLVRMSDKYIRISNLREDSTNERVGESIIDTLRDLAAYALIAICLIQERQKSLNPFHIVGT